MRFFLISIGIFFSSYFINVLFFKLDLEQSPQVETFAAQFQSLCVCFPNLEGRAVSTVLMSVWFIP